MLLSLLRNPLLYIFVISMLPVVELRGAIPAAALLDIPFPVAYGLAVAGNMLPVPLLIPFAKRIILWLSNQRYVGDFFTRFIHKADEKAKQIGRYELLGLCLFVAVPLPGTGAWTGSVIAGILRLRLLPAFLSIGAVVMISGVIMGVISYGAAGLLDLLLI